MLKKPKLNKNTWKTLDRNNVYFQFLEECRGKVYDSSASLHVHHIIPKYVLKHTAEGLAYMNLPENLLVLSEEDHIKAHVLLYEVYGNKDDQGACHMLKGAMSESRQIWRELGARAVHAILKEKGATVYSAEWQKEMATRSLARPVRLRRST